MSDKDNFKIEIPRLNNVNQMITDAIINGSGVRQLQEEAARELERERLETKRFRINLWVGIVIGFVLGIAASLIASYLFFYFGPTK